MATATISLPETMAVELIELLKQLLLTNHYCVTTISCADQVLRRHKFPSLSWFMTQTYYGRGTYYENVPAIQLCIDHPDPLLEYQDLGKGFGAFITIPLNTVVSEISVYFDTPAEYPELYGPSLEEAFLSHKIATAVLTKTPSLFFERFNTVSVPDKLLKEQKKLIEIISLNIGR